MDKSGPRERRREELKACDKTQEVDNTEQAEAVSEWKAKNKF